VESELVLRAVQNIINVVINALKGVISTATTQAICVGLSRFRLVDQRLRV